MSPPPRFSLSLATLLYSGQVDKTAEDERFHKKKAKAAPRVTNDHNHDFNNVVVHRPYRDEHNHQSTPHVLTALLLVLTQHTEGNRRRETR